MVAKKRPTASKKQGRLKKTPGRPRHIPTPQSRQMVRALVFEGCPQFRVARHLGLDIKTLVRHYRDELDLSTEQMCGAISQNLVRIALRPNGGNATVAAAKFVLSCKANWVERSKLVVEAEGKGITAILEIIKRAPSLNLPFDLDNPKTWPVETPSLN
jgi:hypothetical protein